MQSPNALLAEPDQSLSNRTSFADWVLGVSLGLIGCLGILYLAVQSILLIRLPFKQLPILALCVIFTGMLILWGRHTKRIYWRTLWSSFLLAGVIIAFSVWRAGVIYDTSFDGQGYHQLAAFSIHNGWNPLYNSKFPNSLWVENYPKGAWLLSAAIYTLTGHLESGKAINLIAMIASFCSAIGVLLKIGTLNQMKMTGRPKKWMSILSHILMILIAACAACNPVTIVQLFTNYNDGLIGSLLLTLLCVCTYYALTHQLRTLIIAAICVVLLVNIKFTAIAYAGLICGWLIVALMIIHWRKYSRSSWKSIPAYRAIRVLLCGAVIGILFFGWNPYVFNTIKHGHPFYPLAGKNAINIMTYNSPDNFIGHNRLHNFLLSYSSKTEDAVTPMRSTHTELWPISWDDFRKVNVDTRVAGFGPLSLWIMAVSALLWMLTLVLRWKTGVVSTLLIVVLLTTVFINPEPWWARYVPQLWLASMILIAAGWMSNRRIIQTIACFLLIICGTDALKSANSIFDRHVEQSTLAQKQLTELAGKKLTVYPKGFTSPIVHLEERGIAYTIDPHEPACKNPAAFVFTMSLYCEQTGE